MQTFNKNLKGKDWIVGDIHGNFSKLTDLLIERKFDFDNDRLFCTGDLVDRGPESHLALDWLAYPWFHTVKGNHEEMAISYGGGGGPREGSSSDWIYIANGGQWFIDLTREQRKPFVQTFKDLPFRIQILDAEGNPDVGIVHAQAPMDWLEPDTNFTMTWERFRVQYKDLGGTKNIRKVYLGHTPLRTRMELGNNIYIDTGACFKNGFFTLEEI